MITISNISKSYGNKRVLKDIDISIQDGNVQAILGSNGAGKTTLIHILSGLSRSDHGKFNIDGKSIQDTDFNYRKNVGYVFETPLYLEKLSVREFLTFVAKSYGMDKVQSIKRIDELLEIFELPSQDKKNIDRYSNGMKGKVSLAAAFLHNPKYLILDEPFSGLDFVSIQKTSRLLLEKARAGGTVLITSHQFDVIFDICDNVALLKDGTINFNISKDELISLSEKYSDSKNSVRTYLEKIMEDKYEK